MLTYAEAKTKMIEYLSQAADFHDSGAFDKVEDGFDSIDATLPRDKGPEFSKLHLALVFWDSWIDARNHQWKYYRGISAEDWPILARRVVADLRADQEITDPLLLERFGPK